jgi:hypothetical protein
MDGAPVSVKGPVPVLNSVADWDGDAEPTVVVPKVRLAGLTCAMPCVPVPLSDTTVCPCGVWIRREPGRGPVVVGAKTTLTLQLWFGVRLPGQF